MPKRRGPKPRHSDEELLGIRGEGHRKVLARLSFRGISVGKDRVLRVMCEHRLLSPARVGRKRGPKTHDGTIRTAAPELVLGTDATRMATSREGEVWVFAVLDHCTGEIMGIHASKKGTRFEALVPIHQAVAASFGSLETSVAVGLALRHDHGTQYMGHHFQDELIFLGIESSPSSVTSPQGNGVAERFMRTLKEQLLWIRNFDGVEDLREALLAFMRQYNANWLVESRGHRTLSRVRADLTLMTARCRPIQQRAPVSEYLRPLQSTLAREGRELPHRDSKTRDHSSQNETRHRLSPSRHHHPPFQPTPTTR